MQHSTDGSGGGRRTGEGSLHPALAKTVSNRGLQRKWNHVMETEVDHCLHTYVMYLVAPSLYWLDAKPPTSTTPTIAIGTANLITCPNS